MLPGQVKNTKWFLIFTQIILEKKHTHNFNCRSGSCCWWTILVACLLFCLSQLSPNCLSSISSSWSVKMFALFGHLPQQKSHQNFTTLKHSLLLLCEMLSQMLQYEYFEGGSSLMCSLESNGTPSAAGCYIPKRETELGLSLLAFPSQPLLLPTCSQDMGLQIDVNFFLTVCKFCSPSLTCTNRNCWNTKSHMNNERKVKFPAKSDNSITQLSSFAGN